MDNEVWQQLLSLESRDITEKWFREIHSRSLNARRAKEINSSAKQAREYFRNSGNSHYSVKPLLTFYGVASLTRALILLLKKNGGEETLTGSHGLDTTAWGTLMSGDLSEGIKQLGSLKITTCKGLFNDLLIQTGNGLPLHVRSSLVDGFINYDVPVAGTELLLTDILERLPDLKKDFEGISSNLKYSIVSDFTKQNGFYRIVVNEETFSPMKNYYEFKGYYTGGQREGLALTTDTKHFDQCKPLFVHSYIGKIFNSIPSLHISHPFPGDVYFSQLSITYMLSFILGMLVRYYPTQWIALSSGEKGDEWWPVITRSQQYVEQAFPELVMEFITYKLKISQSTK